MYQTFEKLWNVFDNYEYNEPFYKLYIMQQNGAVIVYEHNLLQSNLVYTFIQNITTQ